MRREGTNNWQRADQVVGLFRAAAMGHKSGPTPVASQTAPAPRLPAPIPRESSARGGRTVLAWVASLALAFLVVAAIDQYHRTLPVRFPPSQLQPAAGPAWRFWWWQSLTFDEWMLLWFDAVLLGVILLQRILALIFRARAGR